MPPATYPDVLGYLQGARVAKRDKRVEERGKRAGKVNWVFGQGGHLAEGMSGEGWGTRTELSSMPGYVGFVFERTGVQILIGWN